jgi:hypothetical protein
MHKDLVKAGRTRTWAGGLAALLACAVAAAEVRPKPEVKPKPPEEKKAAEGAAAPEDAKPPASEDDARRLDAVELRFKDWDQPRGTLRRDGLKVEAALVPDALVYRAVAHYLSLRQSHEPGKRLTHDEAVKAVAALLGRWKRYEGASLLVVRLDNEEFKPSKTDRRVFTLDPSSVREAFVLNDARKGRLPVALASNPRNLRQAQLRVKKFWVTMDGLTRRVARDPSPVRDPAAIGRRPQVSKPVPALVLEEKPAELEFVVPSRLVEKAAGLSFDLSLSGWRRYEGPFEADFLDLNENRQWKDLDAFGLALRLPPSGLETSAELKALFAEFRAAAGTKP